MHAEWQRRSISGGLTCIVIGSEEGVNVKCEEGNMLKGHTALSSFGFRQRGGQKAADDPLVFSKGPGAVH